MLEIYIQYSGSSAVLQYLIFLKKSKELIKIKPALAGLLPERSNGIRCRRYARHYLIRAKSKNELLRYIFKSRCREQYTI